MEIQCRGLSVSFAGIGTTVHALRDVSIDCAEGEFLSVIGHSGCGKTTLLRALAGLLQPSAGSIDWRGERSGDGRIATVQQDGGLFPWLTVIDNATFALEAQGVGRREREEGARELLQRFGLGGRETSYPHQISAGMRQRVSVARSFLSQPKLLLMDEPFGALDALARLQIQQELLALWEQRRTTIVFVTHDVDEAIVLSDRILVLGGNPGTVLTEYRVPLARPRSVDMAFTEPYQELRVALLAQLGIVRGSASQKVVGL